MYKIFQIAASMILLFTLAGCSEEQAQSDVRRLWVTLLPQKVMVEAVAGDQFAVEIMVRPGQGPDSYSPSATQMAALTQAEVYFGLGMPLERRILTKIEKSMPQVKFIQTGQWIEETHDGHQDCSICFHGDQDPHLWMDPDWMQSFAKTVRDTLIEIDPAGAESYTANTEVLLKKLSALDEEIALMLKPYKGRAFYINHPSLGHFAERYGLVQLSIEQAGSAPSAKQISDLIESAKIEKAGAIFTQPEFSRSSADVLARALGVDVLEVDVLAADYFHNMRQISQQLAESLSR